MSIRPVWLAGFLFCCLILNCTLLPLSPTPGARDYEFAAWFLDTYFIFRDKMPDDLFDFDSPQELYSSVREPYTLYVSPEEQRAFMKRLSTSNVGIGIRSDSATSGYVIKDVFSQSPGARAGLERNDTIVAIDSISMVGVKWEVATDYLSNKKENEMVKLLIHRGQEQFHIIVVLGMYLSPSVFIDTLDQSIAYIWLTAFFSQTYIEGGSAQEFRRALEQTRWAEHTIMDLRKNGGGEIGQCIEIIEELVDSGNGIITFHERQLDTITFNGFTHDTLLRTEKAGVATKRKISILVDSYTASASEILVSCLKNARPEIKIYGSKTYGKARAQVLAFSPDSGIAKVTFATLRGVDGSSYDLVGISPDVKVEHDADALEVAIQAIRAGSQYKRKGPSGFRSIQMLHETFGQHVEPLAIIRFDSISE